jgi:hypothetical protein
MRVAALYDIHANLPALEAVIADVSRAGVDRIVVGGDVVPGPMPRETIENLLALDIPVQFIEGNGDRDELARMRGVEPLSVPAEFRDAIAWNATELHPEFEPLLAGWPQILRLATERQRDLHAGPPSEAGILESFARVELR